MNVVDIKNNGVGGKKETTLEQALQTIIEALKDETRNTPINNLVVISQTNTEYQFAFLNTTNLRSMLGTIDCVKSYVIDVLNNHTEYGVD